MKNYIYLIILLFTVSCASVAPMSDSMREVVKIENHSLTQEEAYSKTLLWVAETYNSSNDVLQLQDPESGTIVISAVHTVTRAGGMVSFPASYNMTIDFNEEQVRFTQRVGSPRDPSIGGITEGDAEKMHEHFELLRESLLDYLSKSDDF